MIESKRSTSEFSLVSPAYKEDMVLHSHNLPQSTSSSILITDMFDITQTLYGECTC